jgi:predicted transposase YdaD
VTQIHNPHDKFFQTVFGRKEWAQTFLAHHLPEPIVRLVDLSTLDLQSGSFVDPTLREHFTDLLYKAQLNDGKPSFLYILFEHKSYPERFASFQLLRYLVRIWERELREEKPTRLTPIFPLLVYHGEQPWNIPTNFAALVDAPAEWRAYVPDFNYALQDLSASRGHEYPEEPLLRAAIVVFRRIFDKLLLGEIPDILTVFEQVYWDTYVRDFLFAMLNYIAAANPYITEEDLEKAIARLSPRLGGNLMQTLAEKWIEQGLEQGLEQGIEQGIEQGARRELLESIKAGLEIKFGDQGLFLLREISKIESLATLRALNMALFRVTSLDEVRRIYQQSNPSERGADDANHTLN